MYAKTIILMLIFPLIVLAQPPQIFMDGQFEEWQSVSPLYSDPPGDQQSGNLDFGKLWVTNDGDYLYLRIEVGEEINMQDLNNITLYLDTDDNASTGISIHGIGAELQWTFGTRNGIFKVGSSSFPVAHRNIGLVTMPTITSNEFEIALDRQAKPDNLHLLFTNSTIRVVFIDEGIGQDHLPDVPGGVSFTFAAQYPLPVNPISIRHNNSNSFRILSYNVLSDGLFESSKVPAFTRILQAIRPTIIGFQEIYNHSASETANQVESILPSPGQQWYSSKGGPDNIVVSRYPILSSYQIEGNGGFVIDLNPDFNSQLLLIVAHLPASSNNSGRQLEADAIMAFIRDAKNPGGLITVPTGTPMMIIGDLNLVGYAQQLITLLTGDIVNTGQFGNPFPPDWDDTDLDHILPRSTDIPFFYTWYSPPSSYSPGKLDYMIFSDSVIESVKKFVLFTPAMSSDSLVANNLQPGDVETASDHLPLVSDFVVTNTTGFNNHANNLRKGFGLEQNYPNPFNPSTTIRFHIPTNSHVKLAIYNTLGETVKTLLNEQLAPNEYDARWDGKNDSDTMVSGGIYFVRLSAASETGLFADVKKIVHLK
jgi:endonuclease/exonuclease/phosphatase family metal-dependent hydrolase